jgi:hypothetical protein
MATETPSIPGSYARDPLDFQSRAPPPVAARYFYASPLPIDDPLSPIPPPNAAAAAGGTYYKPQAPRPFSQFDNEALEKEWEVVRKRKRQETQKDNTPNLTLKSIPGGSKVQAEPVKIPKVSPTGGRFRADSQPGEAAGSLPSGSLEAGESSLTKTPFIRAPSRGSDRTVSRSTSVRPTARPLDSYNWGEDTFSTEPAPESPSRNISKSRRETLLPQPKTEAYAARVPVGVSRLHSVTFPDMQMIPIYWVPVGDIAPVIRATWFYADTMLPVETEIANLLEAGYISIGAWTETWKDEVNSAVEYGAIGEMKLVHKLWPEKAVPKKPVAGMEVPGTVLAQDLDPIDPEKEKREMEAAVAKFIDDASGVDGADNKASGSTPFGKDGVARTYKTAGVMYANDKDAYILKPSLLPSKYYGRRPLANSIRRGRSIGIRVVRGFDLEAWKKLHPDRNKSIVAKQAREGVSSSEDGAPQSSRQVLDPTLAQSERPQVTDLVLVVHGIGQKLSERMESYHFTHAINTFRREANVELGDATVKSGLKKDMGGIMILPVSLLSLPDLADHLGKLAIDLVI